MTNMEQDKSPGKRVIDISTWSRRSNFEFFRDFVNPNLGVTARVDVRHAYDAAKTNGVSFFLSYFYAILCAVNEIQEFHYRFDQEGNVVYYDRIDGLAPIRVEEKDNFAEMVFPFAEDFDTFCQNIFCLKQDCTCEKDIGMKQTTVADRPYKQQRKNGNH